MKTLFIAIPLITILGCTPNDEERCRDEDTTVVSIDLFTSTGRGRYGDYQVNNATVKLKRDDGTVCVFMNHNANSQNTYNGYVAGDRLRKLK